MMTGTPYSQLRLNEKKERDFNIIKTGLDRPRTELFERIEKRTDQMVEQGLIEEVKSLLPYRHLNALNTVGYKEIFKYLDGDWSLKLAIEKIKTNTRRYAKRQLTWFKKDKEMVWFYADEMGEIIKYLSENSFIE